MQISEKVLLLPARPGAFGVVYRARDKQTGLEFCCKTVRKELLTAEIYADIK